MLYNIIIISRTIAGSGLHVAAEATHLAAPSLRTLVALVHRRRVNTHDRVARVVRPALSVYTALSIVFQSIRLLNLLELPPSALHHGLRPFVALVPYEHHLEAVSKVTEILAHAARNSLLLLATPVRSLVLHR